MEVIELDDDDDDFIQSVNPAATRKSTSREPVAPPSKTTKVSKRPPPISTRIDSDPILKSSTSSSSLHEDECPICGRDLKLLNEQRRSLHLNSCLDDGETKADHDKKMDKWKSTMDCPVCKIPLAAGPFRSAHIKKCGREHAINGRDLLNLVNTQEKVTETRRKRALPHTSAKTPKVRPKKVSKLEGEPKSLADEELLMAQALSASLMEPSEAEAEEERRRKEEEEKKEKEKAAHAVSPMFTRIINENIRKRRSYAVVELAPRGCKCDVLEAIQTRFLRIFRARRKVLKRIEKRNEGKEKGGEKESKGRRNGEKEKNEEEGEVKKSLAEGEQTSLRRVQMEATMANTLARLDSLSWAYRKLAMEGEERGDVSIDCKDGKIRAFSWSLMARTTALGRVVEENAKISIDQPTTVVRHWLQYVYCAQVEWVAGEENDGVREIAKQHGPEGLVEECARMSRTRREYRGFGRIGAVTEQDTVPTVTPPPATVPSEATVTLPPATLPSEATVPPEETPEEAPESQQAEGETPLPSDDARVEEKDKEDDEKQKDGTLDSEGSMSDALKKCAANGRAAARSSSPRPRDSAFLAALEAPPVVTVATPTPATTVPQTTVTPSTVPPPQESPKDSFFESIVYGDTPQPRKEDAQPPTVIPPSTVVPQPADPSESTESMDESDAMRNILDVSCLRRSPRIRVEAEKEGEEERLEELRSPELFEDSGDNGRGDEQEEGEGERSQRVLSPLRRSPRHSPFLVDTVTPTTSRTTLLRKSIKKTQDVIYLDDTPVASPVTVAKPSSPVLKKEEEGTVDESFPRADLPSYGQGGMDTVDGGEEGGENRDDPMEFGGGDGEDYGMYDDYDYDYGNQWDDNWANNGQEEEGEDDAVTSARAREEVDSFLQSLGFNETRRKSASPSKGVPPPTEEIDSFLLSFRAGLEKTKEDSSGDGTGDILGALSPVRPATETAFNTPTVRGGRGRGRGRGAVFGSHVKVLKWSNVTPKPRFEAMDDAALKAQLARFGLRPMGRKRAIAMLSEIYEQTHPVVDESAAAAGPSTSSSSTASGRGGGDISPSKGLSTVADEDEDEENDGEKTLNRGADSSFEDDSERGEGVGEAEESMIIPKALLKSVDNQLVKFLEWLRQPQQKNLYDHCLALRSISLEELEVKLRRADSELCGISRRVLMCVLDRLHITYSMPQEGWKKRNEAKKKRAEKEKEKRRKRQEEEDDPGSL